MGNSESGGKVQRHAEVRGMALLQRVEYQHINTLQMQPLGFDSLHPLQLAIICQATFRRVGYSERYERPNRH